MYQLDKNLHKFSAMTFGTKRLDMMTIERYIVNNKILKLAQGQ